jgi:anti-sigma factor RsiW
VTCDDVREQLADHVLGSLPEDAEVEVRRHLRGCMTCRRDLRTLEEGVSTFARAAHQVQPPPGLRDRVLATLEDEQAEQPETRRRVPGRMARVAVAAAVAALAGALAWTGITASGATNRAALYEAKAQQYQTFLDALGGKDVRVGTLRQHSDQAVTGSIVMYDSDKGQSWILVLVRAPGETGQADVTVLSPRGSRIHLHPLRFGAGGEASTWLVTGGDISRFDRVVVADRTGTVLASGTVSHE